MNQTNLWHLMNSAHSHITFAADSADSALKSSNQAEVAIQLSESPGTLGSYVCISTLLFVYTQEKQMHTQNLTFSGNVSR